VPPISDMTPTTEITLTVLHQGTPLPCTGPAGSDVFKFVTKITGVIVGPGTVVVAGSGFGTASPYACRLQRAGASAVNSAATFVSPTELRCNTTGAAHTRRHGDFALTVATAAGDVVPQYHSEVLSSRDPQGFLIPTAQSSVTLEIDTCVDRFRNNLETDVDCGGTACPGCGLGQRCAAHADCASPAENLCLEGVCAVRDRDGDGQSEADGDCNDYNAAVNSQATEARDGIDNNCDGQAADGDFAIAKFRNAPTQYVWEFNSVTITGPMNRDTLPQTNPMTIYSLTDITIRESIILSGLVGDAAAPAGQYATRIGGAPARTALNRKGGNGHRCCGGHSAPGIGPGAGPGGRYAGYGPGGGGAGHAVVGGRGGRGNGQATNGGERRGRYYCCIKYQLKSVAL